MIYILDESPEAGYARDITQTIEVSTGMKDAQSSNEAVQSQFSRQAQKYEASPVHANGEDLAWIVEAAALTGTERVLDVGTGTGHTAMALSQRARTVAGADLTERMVESATSLAEKRGLVNVQFVVSDVVRMPFPSSYFDLVTCRFAAHHFIDPDGAVAEIARVLKPGGRIILVDHIAPESPKLDQFINRLDWLRDASHVREWTIPEWLDKLRQGGIESKVVKTWDLPLEFDWWIQQSSPTKQRIEEIVDMLQNADDDAKTAFHIRLDGDGQPLQFSLQCSLIQGGKTA